MKAMMSAVVLLVLGVCFIACDEAIPEQNVQLAKQAIIQAVEANAEYYDSENLEKAQEGYSDALVFIVSGDNARAREMTMVARQAADNATANSRRLYAEEMIERADDAIAEAMAARAGYLASNDLDRARQNLQNAQDKYDDGDMIAAASAATDAVESAERARSGAMGRMQDLEKAISDAQNAIQRAGNNEVVTTYAQVELDVSRGILARSISEKEKLDDPAFGAGGDAGSGILVAAEAYTQSMRFAKDALDFANDAVRIGLEREREFYRRRAVNTMDEAKRLLDEIQRLKEQGLIRQLVIPPPVVPDSGSTPAQTTSADTLTNLEKYEAALEALKRAEENYSDEDFRATIAEAEEAIRIARMVQRTDGSTMGPQQQQQQQQPGTTDPQRTYTVRLHDSLWRIASYPDIYGDAALWPRIWQANRDQIEDPDLIHPDQELIIPPR